MPPTPPPEPVSIQLQRDPSPGFLAPIGAGLRAVNEAQVGKFARRPLALRAEQAGRVVGGAYGWLQWGWLYTDWLWVDEPLRGTGLGTRLLGELEGIARQEGIRRARLNTGSFQAPGFYQKRGYRVFAELPVTADDGREHVDYFLRKEL